MTQHLISNSFENDLKKVIEQIPSLTPRKKQGLLKESTGALVRIKLDKARIGDLCDLVDQEQNLVLPAEIIAVQDNEALLSPYGSVHGLSAQVRVVPRHEPLSITVSEQLLGKVINAFGAPLSGENIILSDSLRKPVRNLSPNPLKRPLIKEVFQTGISVIDGMMTLGRGQRISISGEPGSGKSKLLSMIAHNAKVDVCVIGLIGERGREVQELLHRQLTVSARSNCITVVSTSDRPPMERVIAAHTATTIAEYFRDQGKSVLLLIDSITRFARALRELGLAAGEPPARKGFPPSVFAELPKIIERTGCTNLGSITAIYSILLEGDILGDPVVEEMQSLTDGHIVLNSEKAQAGQFPAVDILKSKSRVMGEITSVHHQKMSSHIRQLLKKYSEIELLLQVGEYQKGSEKLADEAITKYSKIQEVFQQEINTLRSFEHTQQEMEKIIK